MQIEIQLIGDFQNATTEELRARILKAVGIVDAEIQRYGFAAKNVRDEDGELIAQVVTH